MGTLKLNHENEVDNDYNFRFFKPVTFLQVLKWSGKANSSMSGKSQGIFFDAGIIDILKESQRKLTYDNKEHSDL